MVALEAIHRAIDWLNDRIGRVTMWFGLVLVLLYFGIVGLRYAFATTFIVMQEAVIYVHATLFMLGASYTLLYDGHVRVDILYADARPRTRAWIELTAVFVAIVPFCLLVLWSSWPFVYQSWTIREGSMVVGGIPAVYLLKTLIPAFAVLLLLQGVSIMLRSILVLTGRRPEVFTQRLQGASGQ